MIMVSVAVGGVNISTYWLMLILGTVGMFLCAYYRKELFAMKLWQCAMFTLLLTLVGVAGAMLLYFLECGSIGGVSFFGSVFFIPMLMPLVGLMFHLKPGQTLDICAPCVAIMIGCMRFNCFLSGCCGGWEMCVGTYSFSWPTQTIDSIGDFVFLIWLLRLESQQKEIGKLYPLFMIAYSSMRFLLEFLRNTPKDYLGLSLGQWYSIIALAIGYLYVLLNQKKKPTQ